MRIAGLTLVFLCYTVFLVLLTLALWLLETAWSGVSLTREAWRLWRREVREQIGKR